MLACNGSGKTRLMLVIAVFRQSQGQATELFGMPSGSRASQRRLAFLGDDGGLPNFNVIGCLSWSAWLRSSELDGEAYEYPADEVGISGRR